MPTIYTLNPDTLKYNEGFLATGGGTMVSSVNDANDATFIRKNNESTTRSIRYGLGNPTLAATDIVWRCLVTLRSYQGANGSLGTYVGSSLNSTTLPALWVVGTIGSGTTLTDYSTFSVEPRSLTTSATTEQALANALEVQLTDFSPSGGSPINRATIAKVSVTLETTTRPTTTVLGIDGDTVAPFAVTTTTQPTLEWSYTQADSISQYAYEVRVFTASRTDPSVNTNLVWGSGVQVGTGITSIQIPVDLVNGTTYFAYVRNAMRIGGVDYWSAWGSGTASSQLQFTVSLTAPTTPTVTTSWDSTNQRTTVTATGAAYASGTQTFRIERRDTATGPWRTVRGASALVPNGSFVASIIDTETPRGARGTNRTITYRATAVGVVSGLTVSSAPSAGTNVTVVTDGRHWIKDLTDSTLNRGGLQIIANDEFQAEEIVEVLRPLGRTDAVVVSGALGGDDGSITIVSAGATAWADLRALLIAQKTVLWQDPFGEQRYIRPISRSWVRTGDATAPRWELTISYVEVPVP